MRARGRGQTSDARLIWLGHLVVVRKIVVEKDRPRWCGIISCV